MTPKSKRAIAIECDVFNRAVQPRHAAGDRAAFERRAGRAGGGEDAMFVAQD